MYDAIVLDATAFYAGVPFLSSYRSYYTTPQIIDEVKHIKRSIDAVNILVDINSVNIIEPSPEYVRRVIYHADRYGEDRLSYADISIVALALMLDSTLVSDDLAVLNLAYILGVKSKSLTNKGDCIKYAIRWIRYCKICDREYYGGIDECLVCGSRLRKYKRRV
jgi:UPF0271 protein